MNFTQVEGLTKTGKDRIGRNCHRQKESSWPSKRRAKAMRFSNFIVSQVKQQQWWLQFVWQCQLMCACWVSHCAFGRKCRIIVWLFELPPLYKPLEWVATYKKRNLKCLLSVAILFATRPKQTAAVKVVFGDIENTKLQIKEIQILETQIQTEMQKQWGDEWGQPPRPQPSPTHQFCILHSFKMYSEQFWDLHLPHTKILEQYILHS